MAVAGALVAVPLTALAVPAFADDATPEATAVAGTPAPAADIGRHDHGDWRPPHPGGGDGPGRWFDGPHPGGPGPFHPGPGGPILPPSTGSFG